MSDLLAIETSGSACSVALGRGGDVSGRHLLAPRQQIERVLPMVAELLAERQTTLSGLAGIAFGQGPGSFTGIRIALAVAQGLALARDLPLVGVSSLAALAQGAHGITGRELFLVAQDARMGEVYWAAYEIVAGLARLRGRERLGAPGTVRPPAAGDWLCLGNGWGTGGLALPGAARPGPDAGLPEVPNARDVLTLAEPVFAAGRGVSARDAHVTYLREQVAKPPGGARN